MAERDDLPDDPEEILEEVGDETPPEDPDEGEEGEAEPDSEAEESGDETPEDGENAGALAAPAKPRKKSASDRIRELNDNLRREREARQVAEARAAARQEVEAGHTAARRAAEEAEEARLVAAMTPEEKAIYSVAKGQRQQQNEMQALRQQIFDSNDRSAFTAKYANDPRFAKFLPDVEERTRQMHAQGVPIQREAVLKFLIGERAMSAPAKKAGTQQRQAAGARRAAAQGNTRGGRSDTGRTAPRDASLIRRMELENGAV